jgi:hypothetical protein
MGLVSVGLLFAALILPSAIKTIIIDWIDPPVLVSGYIGGSKANLLENPDVQQVLRDKYRLRVGFEPIGGLEQVCDIKKPYDYLWPGTLVSVEGYERCHDGAANFNSTLFSPIVIYTWEPVVRALSSINLVEVRSDGVSFVDMRKLVRILLDRRTSWPPALGLDGNISVETCDPTKCNSGEMFAAMLARLGRKDQIAEYFAQFEPKRPRTVLLFEECYATGMRACPMFVAYESLLSDYIGEKELNCKDTKALRIIYPRPTIWATHPMIAATEKGKRLLAALRDPVIQKIAWEKHGFRVGSRIEGPRGCHTLPDSDDIPSLQLPTPGDREYLQKALQ